VDGFWAGRRCFEQVSARTSVPARDVEQWVWAAHPHQPTPQAAYHALQQERHAQPVVRTATTALQKEGPAGPRHDTREFTERDWQLVAAANAGETRPGDIAKKLGTRRPDVSQQLTALAGKLGLNAVGGEVLPKLPAERLLPADGTLPVWPPTTRRRKRPRDENQ